MGCCGSNRGRVYGAAAAAAPVVPARHYATVAVFRYDGTTGMTIVGPTTGRKYWFEGPGAEVAVDLRDRASIAQIPMVREVRLA
jgi:hypothetical protein